MKLPYNPNLISFRYLVSHQYQNADQYQKHKRDEREDQPHDYTDGTNEGSKRNTIRRTQFLA